MKKLKKLYHDVNCRGCKGLYLKGESLSGLCTCIPVENRNN